MKLLIMDNTGHSELEFAKDDAGAAKKFMELTGAGFTAATRRAGEREYEVIRDPGKMLDETLFKSRNVGG